jgi:hypothetical protein
VCISLIYAAGEANGSQRNEDKRYLIRKVLSKRIASGDAHLQLVEGTDLLGPSRVDGLSWTAPIQMTSAFSGWRKGWPRGCEECWGCEPLPLWLVVRAK